MVLCALLTFCFFISHWLGLGAATRSELDRESEEEGSEPDLSADE